MSTENVKTGGVATHGEHTQTRRRGGFKGHCKRFWWIYAIIFVLIAILVPVLIIFVAIPKIAQQKIDAAVLTVQGISVSDTTASQYTMSINSTITTDGSVHAKIDGFDGVMYLEDHPAHTPFVTVRFPETESLALQTVNVTQVSQVKDAAAFLQFNTWLLHNKTLKVTVEGDTTVHLNGLSRSYGVHFKKTLELEGVNMFDGTKVLEPNVSISPGPDGYNFRGIASIPNTSKVTFEVGNATFYNYLLGKDIGEVFLNNLTLRPGINLIPMVANITGLSTVLTAWYERPYCENGILPVQLRGKTVVNKGQPLVYFADALASANQSVPLDLSKALPAVGFNMSCKS